VTQHSPVLPGRVVWSGENPIVSLKSHADGPETTNVTFFRIVYSPVGRGHAAFVSTGSLGGLGVGFTDNLELGAWLRDRMLPVYPCYTERDTTAIPLRSAAFASSGDPRTEWRELVTASEHRLDMSWSDPGQPFVVDNPGGSAGRLPYHVVSVFIPARRASLMVDGVTAAGTPFPCDISGTPSSTSFLAFSETWLTLAGGLA
jgi:hypothetical protein